MPRQKKQPARLEGNLFLLNEGQQTFATEQVQLLISIEQCGSISSAAKQVGISYKTAWDRIAALNNISSKPLVTPSAGGAQGGGTALTEYGRKIVEGFLAMQQEHQAFLQRLGTKLHSLNDVANFMRIGTMKTSARNQYRGVIKKIIPGAVNAEIILKISDSQSLVVIITEESRKRLGLKVGSNIISLIKASWVMLSKDTRLTSSAENKLVGKVMRITAGAVNSDVVIDLGEGKSVSAIVTNKSVADLGLRKGDAACAFLAHPA